jgi:GNAT superfamily N-acetyltransferase
MNGWRSDGYRVVTTGYAGLEREVLRIRNANRSQQRSPQYLDWRYQTEAGAPEPRIFWIRDHNDRAVGMASWIFRSFWLDGKPEYVALLGDISLDSHLRGKGLGKFLLKCMTEELDIRDPSRLALVIPNDVAQGVLASLGWTTKERFISHVYLFNPENRLRQLLRSAWLAKGIAWPAARLMAGIARGYRKHGYSLDANRELDRSFDTLWERVDKKNVVLGARSVRALAWRYINHPQMEFQLSKLNCRGELAGYIVYTTSEKSRECYVYDLLVYEQHDLLCMLALFVEHIAKQGNIDCLRIALNAHHPYGSRLLKLGFVPRKQAEVFQLYGATALRRSRPLKWFVTQGDKDI